MKKLKRFSLSKLNEANLEKKQQRLILGGWGCVCGSCGEYATAEQNKVANYNGGITGTGTNNPVCSCSGPQGETYAVAL
ncbi:MAG: TIGR04149 family rSAM-modified RiPP [Porphyromonadaceae bacterium]|nr:TIGR04149 family rSAM-modified RiPP [Porphyromonadaceae bacterium]